MKKVKMNKINKEICTINNVKKCILDIYNNVFFGIIEDLGKLSVVIQICSPLLILLMEKQNICTVLCFGVLMTFITRLMTKFYYYVSNVPVNRFDIPVPLKRYTKKDAYGFVTMINQEDILEMISYVNTIENYFEREGMYKNDNEEIKK